MVSTEKGTLRYVFCTNIGQVSSSCHIMEWPIMDDTYYSQCTVCMVRRRHCFYYDTRESTNNKSSICEFFQCQGKSECNILTRVYLLLNTLPSSRDSWYFIYIKHTFVLLYTTKICSSYIFSLKFEFVICKCFDSLCKNFIKLGDNFILSKKTIESLQCNIEYQRHWEF